MSLDTNSFIIGYMIGGSSPNSSGGYGGGTWVTLIIFIVIMAVIIGVLIYQAIDLPECPLCGHEVRTPGAINSRAENFLEPISKSGEWSKNGKQMKGHHWECPYCHGQVEYLHEFD